MSNHFNPWSSWIESIVIDFLHNSPENSLKNSENDKAFEDLLIGYSSGNDPLFQSFKEYVGHFHYTPAEIFNLTFPGENTKPEELTVISWVLPQNKKTRDDNHKQDYFPSERWVRARINGEIFNNTLSEYLVEKLAGAGVQSISPRLSPYWQREYSSKYGYASRWSERHAAYAAGLGTFGLCDGLITPKGKAHRVGSIIAKMNITPSEREYKNHRDYCLFFNGGKCMACAERCPVGAITEDGHDKEKCKKHIRETCGKYSREKLGFDGYGCGLCQTGVPCEYGIPI